MPYLPVGLACAMVAGAAAGVRWPWTAAPAVVLGVSVWLTALLSWHRKCAQAVVPLAVVGVFAVTMALGAAAYTRTARPSLVTTLEEAGLLDEGSPESRSAARFEGTLVADATLAGRGVLLRVDVSRAWIGACGCRHDVDGGLAVTVAGDHAAASLGQWRAGRRIRFTAAVRHAKPYRNYGSPDDRALLVQRRTVLVGSVKSAFLVELAAHGNWLSEAAASARARARTAIARAAAGAPIAAAFGTAVLIGDRSGLDTELRQQLQRAGTYHVVAISGGNIALFTTVAVTAMLLVSRRRSVGLVTAGGLLVAYAALVDGGAPVERATVMALVGIAAQLLDQRGAAINVLALAAGVLLAADPLLAFDVGFWLTTAATAGIIVGLQPGDTGTRRWRRWWRSLVLTSVWAELALLPISALVFQHVTVAGVALSAVAIPGMALVQLGALGAVGSDLVAPPVLPAFGLLIRVGTRIVTESAAVPDLLPWSSWRVPPPAPSVVVLYYLALATWLWAARTTDAPVWAARVRQGSRVAVGVLVVWVAVAPTSLVVWPPRDLQVTAFDVGQGDAVLVQFPGGHRLLVDAGGMTADGRDLGERVIGPALRARGIRRIDYLVVTHADADHIGGAATLVREFRPREVWTGIPVAGHGATAVLRQAADDTGAAWRQVVAGAWLAIGAASVHVLHPPPPEWERVRVRNDDSIVLALTFGGVRVLLTGDVGAAEEARIAEAAAADPDVGQVGLTVLKVAHHGSAGSTSQQFLAGVAPRLALISAGTGNPFGHPAPGVLERLRTAGVDVWRTDVDGEVTVRTDGHTVEVSSFSGRRRWLKTQPR